MNICIILGYLLFAVNGVRLRNQDDGLSAYDEDGPPAYQYVPSNLNTKPPTSFSDEVVPDEAYHELVPALQVLQELTTTPAARTIG